MNDENELSLEQAADSEECLIPDFVGTSITLHKLEKYGLLFDGELVESIVWRFSSSPYRSYTLVEAICFTQTYTITLVHGKDDMSGLPWPNVYGDAILLHRRYLNRKENNHD